jgi:hypothetical protein
MKTLALRFAVALAFALAPSCLPSRQPPIALFNGVDLSGWREIGDAQWSVEDGCLVGEGAAHTSFLVTEREFSDFVLELDLRNESPGNSGIQIRSHQQPDGRVVGLQVEVDPSPRAWSGRLYDEARRGWPADSLDDPRARAAFVPGEWNHFRIECAEARIRTWINGVKVADTYDHLDREGFIGLQVHSGGQTRVRWRNLALSELVLVR